MCGRLCNTRDRDWTMIQQSLMVGTWHDFVDSSNLMAYYTNSMTDDQKTSFEREIADAKEQYKEMIEGISQ